MTNLPFVFSNLSDIDVDPAHINFDCKGAAKMGITLVWLRYNHEIKRCERVLAKTIDGRAIWTEYDDRADAIIDRQVIKKIDGWRLMPEVVAWQ